jgi:release factor glutamine methyltransferase
MMGGVFAAPAPNDMTLSVLLREAARCLEKAGIENAPLDVRLIAAFVLGCTRAQLALDPHRDLSPAMREGFDALLRRRLAGEPLSHILGRREFWSLDFEVTSDTLAPRPESECLINIALTLLPEREAPYHLLDLGTGTGCLILSLLNELPRAQGLGIDISAAALDVARRNAVRLSLDGRMRWRETSWLNGITETFDLILCNPPYLSRHEIDKGRRELAFEPRLALDGGEDGLEAYRRLLPGLKSCLCSEAHVVFEINAMQAEEVSELLTQNHFRVLAIHHDLAGLERCIVAGLPRFTPG